MCFVSFLTETDESALFRRIRESKDGHFKILIFLNESLVNHSYTVLFKELTKIRWKKIYQPFYFKTKNEYYEGCFN